MIDTVESLKARRNGKMARPNVRYADVARATEDWMREVERKTAGRDTDRPRIPWYRRIKVYQLALLVLGAIGLVVMAWR